VSESRGCCKRASVLNSVDACFAALLILFQWSLPLPARSEPAATSSISGLATLRARLLELGLPAVHIDSALSQRVGTDVDAIPLDRWVDRVMDAMYRAQNSALSVPPASSPPIAAAPSLIDVPLPRSSVALAPLSDTAISAGAFAAAASAAVCGICWDPIPPSAVDAQSEAPPCHVRTFNKLQSSCCSDPFCAFVLFVSLCFSHFLLFVIVFAAFFALYCSTSFVDPVGTATCPAKCWTVRC
jgi:hypothetical protein